MKSLIFLVFLWLLDYRTAPASVVGWPPIRSFRKNLSNTSASKQASESPNTVSNKDIDEKPVEASRKGLFVKINMDGVPIGRKVDLTAYDSYEKLSTAVDELFRGLLAGDAHNFNLFIYNPWGQTFNFQVKESNNGFM